MGLGKFSNGNIKPLNNKVGIIKPISDISNATCCDFAAVEIKMPNANEQKT